MNIRRLTSIVPPPDRPVDNSDDDSVSRHEARLALRLPSDIVELARIYGSGCFFVGVRIEVFNPLSPTFYDAIWEHTCVLAGNRSDVGSHRFPYEVYPQSPGLLPWASDDLGNEICWNTDGQPDCWNTVIYSEEGDFEEIPKPAVDFLVGILQGAIQPQVWADPRVWNPLAVCFEPTEAIRSTELLQTIYELYVRNSNRAGFWTRDIRAQDGVLLFIRAINGRSEDPLTGIPVEYGRPSVDADLYLHGRLFEARTNMEFAYQQVYVKVDEPNEA